MWGGAGSGQVSRMPTAIGQAGERNPSTRQQVGTSFLIFAGRAWRA